MLSKDDVERKRITRCIVRPKKYNCWDLILGEYWETVKLNVTVYIILGLPVFIISSHAIYGTSASFFGISLFMLVWQSGCCFFVKQLLPNYRIHEDSDWYSAEEAQVLLKSLEDQKHIYTQRIVVKRRRAESVPDDIVLDESEEIEYEDCFNISSKVDLGGEEREGVTKIYISNVAERGDSITDERFDHKKHQFITQNEGRGDYHEYSAKFYHPETPDFIFVSKRKSDGSPVIPCYHKKVWKTIFRYLWLGACWEAFVESCLSTAVVFYNQKVISVAKIEEELKQSIDKIREENRLKL